MGIRPTDPKRTHASAARACILIPLCQFVVDVEGRIGKVNSGVGELLSWDYLKRSHLDPRLLSDSEATSGCVSSIHLQQVHLLSLGNGCSADMRCSIMLEVYISSLRGVRW